MKSGQEYSNREQSNILTVTVIESSVAIYVTSKKNHVLVKLISS